MSIQGPLFAHPPGQTSLTYTPDGKYLLTAGTNNFIRKFVTASTDEPVTIDTADGNNSAIVASNDKIISGSEDCTVSLYSAATNTLSKLLVRTNLPCRDVALSPDGRWVAVASDERVVRVVDVADTTRTLALRDQSDACRHVAFHPRGHLVAVSCADGVVYVYSLPPAAATHDQHAQAQDPDRQPELVKRLEGIIQRHSGGPAQEGSTKPCWSPDGRALALAAAVGRDIVLVDCQTWACQPRSFSGVHSAGQIVDFAWSPNGAFLATAGSDGKIVLWDTGPPSGGQQPMRAVATYSPHRNVCALAWHPSANTLSFTTSEGRLYTLANAVPTAGDLAGRLKLPVFPAPLDGTTMDSLADAAAATSIRPARLLHPLGLESAGGRGRGRGRDGEEGEEVGDDDDDDDNDDDDDDDDDLDGWIENDDGGGYQGRGAKRKSAYVDSNPAKRPFPGPAELSAAGGLGLPRLHAPFQPSATPWRGKRRYLCLNMVGFVWTVDQDSHHTVTIEFHDREAFRDTHFTDALRHDKACLAEHGALFACPPAGGDGSTEGEHPAMLYYRPHEAWASRATDWRMRLPAGESALSIALSDSYAVACTSAGYVRVYTLSGVPVRVYRQKHGPVVTCASAGDHVLIVANGPLAADGRAAQLTYTLEDVRRDETLQSNDTVALPPDAGQLQSVFFSDRGDPAIFDSAGVLLVLQHWRRRGQARWVPLLDTAALARLASGRKLERYWPVALAQDKFHCIILKGGEQHPFFPRPLLSEFDLKVPIAAQAAPPADGDGDDDGGNGEEALHETYLRHAVLLSLHQDSEAAGPGGADERAEMASRENKVDRALLQLLMLACKDDGDSGARALEICGLFCQRRTLDMAVKVAVKYERRALADKIGLLRDSMDTEEDDL